MITHVGNAEDDRKHFIEVHIKYIPSENTLRICVL